MKHKAFTLVELLIAMAIIAILIAISAYGIALVQRNSRNTQRASFTNDFKIGLEKFYSNYGTYPDSHPASGRICYNSDQSKIMMRTTSGTSFVEVINPRADFLKPASGNSTRLTSVYCYQKRAGGLYSLQYQMENQNGVKWSNELGTSNDPCEDEAALTISLCS